jgi:uncharacterized protein (DUF2336 family)
VIIKAFLRWAETARTNDRAKAASMLSRAYLHSAMGGEERQAAGLALTYLLDDPSPVVRLSLAEALASSEEAPRAIILALAEDQPQIATTIIALSPVLEDADLVDLIGRGDAVTRGVIASRQWVSRAVCAAIAEVGDVPELLLLLDNPEAFVTRISLRRMAERFGHVPEIRNGLLLRDDLPADVRHLLVGHITAALSSCDLVRTTLAPARIERLGREADAMATLAIAGIVPHDELEILVEHLRAAGRLTPAFLIHALCCGRLDFFAGAVVNLSGLEERRVRPILATGRMHALRALFEACGLDRDVAMVFVDSVFLWRQVASSGAANGLENISGALVEKLDSRTVPHAVVSEIRDMVEQLHRADLRSNARAYAISASLAA